MGLDWKKIREDYKARATEKELDGPFDETGNLKGKVVDKLNKEATETIQSKKRRESRAKDKPMTPQEAGSLRNGKRASPETKRRMVLQYEMGAKVTAIAKAEGFTPTTVINTLKAASVYQPGRDMGKRDR